MEENTTEQQDRFTMGVDADGDETITFKVKDLTTYGVLNYDGNEFMATITGYALNIAYNMKLINSLADAEAMANGLADVFHHQLMDQLIAMKNDIIKPPEML